MISMGTLLLLLALGFGFYIVDQIIFIILEVLWTAIKYTFTNKYYAWSWHIMFTSIQLVFTNFANKLSFAFISHKRAIKFKRFLAIWKQKELPRLRQRCIKQDKTIKRLNKELKEDKKKSRK